MQKVFHILFTFLCVSTFEKVVTEGKNMAFSLCLADEERLAETVKTFPCLYDKTKKGYKEKDVDTTRGYCCYHVIRLTFQTKITVIIYVT